MARLHGLLRSCGREIITSFARVMEHLEASCGVLSKERCTGDPARRLGNDLLFDQLAQWSLDAWPNGVSTRWRKPG